MSGPLLGDYLTPASAYAFLAQALQWPLPATCLPANKEQPPAAESGLPW